MWEKIDLNEELVNKSLSLAERDLKTAKNVLREKDYDWCLAIAYNAMLQAGRALMFSKGFRPKGEFGHVAVIEFTKSRFRRDFTQQLLFALDKTRKKRHVAVYEQIEVVSDDEARKALNWAEKFIKRTKEILKK